MVQDNNRNNDTISPLLDFAIEAMLNGSPCSSASYFNTNNKNKSKNNKNKKATTTACSSSSSSMQLIRPSRQSLPQESVLDSPSVASSSVSSSSSCNTISENDDEERSYAGVEVLADL
eukprot:scaffold4239_cov80-Cylindrotheca_fusiformis.AAC.5